MASPLFFYECRLSQCRDSKTVGFYLQPHVLFPQKQLRMRMSQMMSHPFVPQKFMPPMQFKSSKR